MKKLTRRQLRRMLQEERRSVLHEASIAEITQMLMSLGPDTLEKVKQMIASMGSALTIDTDAAHPYTWGSKTGSLETSPPQSPVDISEGRLTRKLLRQMILSEMRMGHPKDMPPGVTGIWEPGPEFEPGFDPEMEMAEEVPPKAQRKLDQLSAMGMPARYNPATGMVELLN